MIHRCLTNHEVKQNLRLHPGPAAFTALLLVRVQFLEPDFVEGRALPVRLMEHSVAPAVTADPYPGLQAGFGSQLPSPPLGG